MTEKIELSKVDNILKKTGNVNHNHCLTADPQDPIPFCYTTDPNVRYEHCDCDDYQMGSNKRIVGQQRRCSVSTTIQGIVMFASYFKL